MILKPSFLWKFNPQRLRLIYLTHWMLVVNNIVCTGNKIVDEGDDRYYKKIIYKKMVRKIKMILFSCGVGNI